MDLIQQYTERQSEFQQEAVRSGKAIARLSLVRLLFFVFGVGILILTLDWNWKLGLAGLILFLLLFYWIIRRFQHLQEEKKHFHVLARLNKQEIQFLKHQYRTRPSGTWYQDLGHPYVGDLDVFGPQSLFQYINRASTDKGQDQLASWLKQAAPIAILKRRQAAIQALTGALDWRQEWQARAERIHDDRRVELALADWLNDEYLVLHAPFLRLSLWLIPLGWAICIFAIAFFGMPWSILLLYILIPGTILARHNNAIDQIHQRTAKASDMLTGMGELLSHLEKPAFEDPWLQELQSGLLVGNLSFSRSLNRLGYYVAQLDVRYNAFALILNLLSLWDLHWIRRLERWKSQEKAKLPEAFEIMAEIEALQSLAATWYNNPSWTLPGFYQKQMIQGQKLGHPLIPEEQRIPNDLHMPTAYHLRLITGSNMAGKSTFLRTIGLNLVLAHAGGPICGNRLQLPLIQIFTSMRTQDNLSESTSSFFAELKRLQILIQWIENREIPIFYLLDEILKGTNSRDRHKGGAALIQQLIQYPSAGLVATHDIELGRLEASYPEQIENWSLEVEIEGDELHFDYLLKRGVTQSFNASILMEKMGIRFQNGNSPEQKTNPNSAD